MRDLCRSAGVVRSPRTEVWGLQMPRRLRSYGLMRSLMVFAPLAGTASPALAASSVAFSREATVR